MTKEEQIALRFYHYLKVTRDTLEYAVKDAKLKAFDFKNRRSFLEDSMNEGEVLHTLINNNGENGEKVKERLVNFLDEVYKSNVIVVSGEDIRVDSAQTIKILQEVVGMRETFMDIVISHIEYLRGVDKLTPELEKLIKMEDYLYRSLASFILVDAMRLSFVEFNKYLNESKGERTPQSNFVANDIGQYIGMLNFVKSRKFFEEPLFDELAEATLKQTQLIEGKLTLEKAEEREAIFILAKQAVDKSVADAEKKWIAVYTPIIKELQIRENNA